MAILSKIRERSTFLILIIGMALFAFVLNPKSIEDFFNSSNANEVGEISGESISRKEFSTALEAYKAQYGNQLTEMQSSNDVWNILVREKIYENQLKNAGISVGENDVWNALIAIPSIRENPQFHNKAGLFDQDLLKEFLATLKQDPNQQTAWASWTSYMAQIKINLENQTYNNLITAGLGASLKEGETLYFNNNTKLNAEYVFVPYTSVPDSLVTVDKSEIESYVKKHAAMYKVDETRDLQVVQFPLTPTKDDEAAIEKKVANLLNDDGAIKGFRNTTNVEEFFAENDSDIPLNEMYQFKNAVSVAIADAVFKGKVGDVFGPYKDRGYFKISKLTEVTMMADSARGAHILIPFIGSLSADESTTKTEEQAKKTADSIYLLVRNNKKKFAALADQMNNDGTKGRGGDTKWTTKDQVFSPNFDKNFANFLFFNKVGTVKVIKSKFGYHVIRLDDQTKKQPAVKLATFARRIIASPETESAVFQNAESFALELSKGKNLYELVKEKNLPIQPAVGLKVLDENVPGAGNQRTIVQWAFNKDNNVGAYKRFDVANGHVVVVLTNKTAEGLMSAAKAAPSAKPRLINEKKALIINKKMEGATLAEIAKTNNTTIKSALTISLQSPIIPEVGYSPKVVGAMAGAKENKMYTQVAGAKGVFAFKVIKRDLPIALPNYDTYRKQIEGTRKSQTNEMYNAIKKAANVKDNRAVLYGVSN